MTYHEQSSTDTSEGSTETKLLSDLDQTAGGSLSWKALGLVDLAEHSVGWLRHDSGSHTGNQTGAQVNGGLGWSRRGALVDTLVDGLGDLLVDDELGHGIWNPVHLSVFIIGPLFPILHTA
jgi:hypothetical protein